MVFSPIMKPFERERIERAEHPLSLISLLISTPIRQHFENTNTFHFSLSAYCESSGDTFHRFSNSEFLSNAGCASNVFVYLRDGSPILGGTEPDKF